MPIFSVSGFLKSTLLFSFIVLSACAEYVVKPAEPEAVMERKTIVVLPVFTVVRAFRPYGTEVHQQLVKELEQAGHDCFVVSDKQYKSLRHQALEQSGSIYNPAVGDFVAYKEDVYAASMIEQLSKLGDFDLMLIPELVLRTAAVDGDQLVWDGVRLPMVVKGERDATFKAPGKARGLSFKGTVYTSNGREVVKRYSGFAVPYYLDLGATPPNYRIRETLYDEATLDVGIKRAIDVLLK